MQSAEPRPRNRSPHDDMRRNKTVPAIFNAGNNALRGATPFFATPSPFRYALIWPAFASIFASTDWISAKPCELCGLSPFDASIELSASL